MGKAKEPVSFAQKVAWEIMVKFPIDVVVGGHPETTNSIWQKRRGGGFFKSAKANAWEALAAIKVRSAARVLYGMHELEWAKGCPFELEVTVMRESWRGKSPEKRGLYVRPDVDNFLKNAVDSVCTALGLDDCAVVKLTAMKQEAPGEPRTHIRLLFLEQLGGGF